MKNFADDDMFLPEKKNSKYYYFKVKVDLNKVRV